MLPPPESLRGVLPPLPPLEYATGLILILYGNGGGVSRGGRKENGVAKKLVSRMSYAHPLNTSMLQLHIFFTEMTILARKV